MDRPRPKRYVLRPDPGEAGHWAAPPRAMRGMQRVLGAPVSDRVAILAGVAGFLRPREIVGCALVCKRWHFAAMSHDSWRCAAVHAGVDPAAAAPRLALREVVDAAPEVRKLPGYPRLLVGAAARDDTFAAVTAAGPEAQPPRPPPRSTFSKGLVWDPYRPLGDALLPSGEVAASWRLAAVPRAPQADRAPLRQLQAPTVALPVMPLDRELDAIQQRCLRAMQRDGGTAPRAHHYMQLEEQQLAAVINRASRLAPALRAFVEGLKRHHAGVGDVAHEVEAATERAQVCAVRCGEQLATAGSALVGHWRTSIAADFEGAVVAAVLRATRRDMGGASVPAVDRFVHLEQLCGLEAWMTTPLLAHWALAKRRVPVADAYYDIADELAAGGSAARDGVVWRRLVQSMPSPPEGPSASAAETVAACVTSDADALPQLRGSAREYLVRNAVERAAVAASVGDRAVLHSLGTKMIAVLRRQGDGITLDELAAM